MLKLNEHLQLWGLFWATVFVIYFLPATFNFLFILFVFLLFAGSKRDYFWLAYFILLNYAPFGFFTEGTREAAVRLPLFSIAAGFSFSTEQIFLFIALGKALLKKQKAFSYFKKHYQVLLIYLLILAIIALFLHNADIGTFLDRLKKVFFMLFAFVLFQLMQTRKEKYKFVFLLAPFVFLILFDALYFLATGGNSIYTLFNPENIRRSLSLGIDSNNNLARYLVSGHGLSQMIFIFSLSYIFIHKEKKNYLLLAALSAFVVVMAGALRSWFVIYSISILFYVFYQSGKIKNTIATGVLFLLLLIPIQYSQTGKMAFGGAFERISTVFTLGEESSASTKSIEGKVTRRLPSQLQYIKENPITGWAFTEKKGDPDVGNFALLVDVGVLGFLIFLWFWLSYIKILRVHIKHFQNKNSKKALKLLMISFLGILLSHFTTNAKFLIISGIFIGFFVFISEFIISEAKLYDQKLNSNKKI
ncbi:MAG: hypothetical protein ACOC2U_00350 [bacterium]